MVRHDLIQTRLNELCRPRKPKGFLDRLFPVRPVPEHAVTLKVRAPKYFFLRAEVFIDDVMMLAQDVPRLTIGSLIFLLYDNFLSKIRSGVPLQDYLDSLTRLSRLYSGLSSELAKKSEIHWMLQEQHQVPDMATLKLAIDRKYALRGEVFLYDLSFTDDQFSMNLDELISVLFMEFIDAVRTGDTAQVMRSVLQYWIDFQDEG